MLGASQVAVYSGTDGTLLYNFSAFPGFTGGVNVSYSYPDINSMFLAAVKADGTVMVPSFHRPWLFNKDLALKDDSGVTKGKVKSLTLTGVHNCCGACCKAIKGTVKKVEGVTGDTAKPKEDTFEVTGDFDAEDLVKALHAAGFHVKVKK